MTDTRPSTSDTTVAYYQPEDLAAVLRMGADFAEAAGQQHDPTALRLVLADSLSVRHDRPPVRVWVGFIDGVARGFLIATLGRLWITGEPVAQELAWWVDRGAPASRLGTELLAAFTQWAQQVAPCAACSTLADLDPRVERLLERRGWRRAELAWIQRWPHSPASH